MLARDARPQWPAHAWPSGRGLRVRISLPPPPQRAPRRRDASKPLGVHRGARICSSGHGSQVLVSQTTRDLLQDEDGARRGSWTLGSTA